MHLLRTIIAILVVLTASCAAPYRALPGGDTCKGPGYYDTKLADGRYRIMYIGPTGLFGRVSAAAKRRAAELCPSGYSAVRDKELTSFLCPGNGMYGIKGVPAVALLVICKSSS